MLDVTIERSLAKHFKNSQFVRDSDENLNNVLHHLCSEEKFIDASRVLPMILAYDPSLRLQKNEFGNFPFHIAASNGQTAVLEVLIRHTTDSVNLQNAAGNTCLHLAVIHNKVEIVNYLMNCQGIDPGLRNEDNKTA